MEAVFGMFIPFGGHMGGGRPDNTLPGGQGGHPWLPGHGWPSHPDHGLPGSPGHPSGQPIPGGGEGHPSHPIALPPDQPWPPGVNPPIVPPNPPPGSIWPPLPPDSGAMGKALVLIYVSGYGARYMVVQLPQPK